MKKISFLIIAFLLMNRVYTQAKIGGTLPIIATNDATCTGCVNIPARISIANAKADGATLGASTFKSIDFIDDGSGLISFNYATAKTFTADFTISGTNTNLFLPDGVDASTPSLAFSSNTGSGFGYNNTSKTLFLSIDGIYRYQMLKGEFDMKDGTNFISGSGKLSINIMHDADINGQDGGVSVSTYGGTASGAGNKKCGTFGGRTSNGTEAIPTYTIADQRLAEFIGKGFTTDWESDNRGAFGIYAAEDHIGSAQGAYCKIRTTRLLTDQAHNSILIDPAGNLGVTYNTTIPLSYPTGWSGATNYDSRFLTIESRTDNNQDEGVLLQNYDGTRGVNLWVDNSTSITYLDNIYNSDAASIYFRLRTASGGITPINAMVITNVSGSSTKTSTGTGGNISAPVSALQIDQGLATASEIRWTTGTGTGGSGQGTGDGFTIGITSGNDAEIRQKENKDLFIYTNNVGAISIIKSGEIATGTTQNPAYRTQNSGSTVLAQMLIDPASSSSTGVAWGFDVNNGFICTRGNGTRRIMGVAFQPVNLDGTLSTGHEDMGMAILTQLDGAAAAERARFDNFGNFLIGGTTTASAAGGTSSVAAIQIFNGTPPNAGVANGVALFSQDNAASAELKVIDESGAITTLSPHNFSGIPEGKSEEMAWSFYSEKDGQYVNVDMLKLARLVEQLTGEKLVYIGEIAAK